MLAEKCIHKVDTFDVGGIGIWRREMAPTRFLTLAGLGV